jgi:hypothetical protein
MPRFDPTEFGRLLARLTRRNCARSKVWLPMRASVPRPLSRSTRGPMLAALRRPARAVGATRAPGGVGPGQAHSAGTARGAGQRGQAAAERRWPGFTALTWWSRWRVT